MSYQEENSKTTKLSMAELIALGLSYTRKEIRRDNTSEHYQEIDKKGVSRLVEKGLVRELKPGAWKITQAGRDYVNSIGFHREVYRNTQKSLREVNKLHKVGSRISNAVIAVDEPIGNRI